MAKLLLWEKDTPFYDPSIDQPLPTLEPFLVDGSKGAVIVCPGGGYVMKAEHEGAPIAKRFNSFGISAFVLDYRVHPYHYPVPLLDAQRAIRMVRAGNWGIEKNKIAILGFSAGGHLCATAATHYDAGNPLAEDPIERVSCRPDAQIPCYAVISMATFAHEWSAKHFFGRGPDEVSPLEYYNMSASHRVTPDTPPAFMWHTSDDATVPVEQSLMYGTALRAYGIPFELHVFPEGRHGLGLGDEEHQVYPWSELAAKWLKRMGF